MSTAAIIVGFVVSTIGFSFFLYGKKQARLPQLTVGGLLMLCPFLVPDATWMAVASAAMFAGLWCALRVGW